MLKVAPLGKHALKGKLGETSVNERTSLASSREGRSEKRFASTVCYLDPLDRHEALDRIHDRGRRNLHIDRVVCFLSR